MPQLGLRARNDLVGFGELLDVRGPGHERIMEELYGPDLHHVQDDLGVLGIILVLAVVQSLARSGQANGRDKLQVETGLAEMMSQSTVIIAGRLKTDPYRQFIAGESDGHVRHRPPVQRTAGLSFGDLGGCERPVWRNCAAVPRNLLGLDWAGPPKFAALASGR